MIQHRQIEAFRAVMLTGAMTAAAELIHVTQPAVSRLIRDLEAELGFTLFHRRSNLVVPTAEAKMLMREVERSFLGLSRIAELGQDIRHGRSGLLRIAALPAVYASFLPRFVASFCKERPNLKVLVDGLPSSAVREGVESGQFDIGIAAMPFQRDLLTVTALNDKAMVAVPKEHRLASQLSIHARDLEGENLILLSKFQGSLHPVEVALQSVRSQRNIETTLSTIACVLVLEQMGVAIVDPFAASDYIGRGLELRPLEPALNFGTAIVCSSERKLSLIAQEFFDAFLEHARRYCDTLIPVESERSSSTV